MECKRTSTDITHRKNLVMACRSPPLEKAKKGETLLPHLDVTEDG